MADLTHITKDGAARMVDVGAKNVTRREARARALVKMKPETLRLITEGGVPKGDVFAAARIAGIMAAKNTAGIIPLCHPLPLDSVEVELSAKGADAVIIKTLARCSYRTGVEMEALTAAAAAALTIYDMCKAVDRGMEITNIALLEKSGGRSGTYIRSGADTESGEA